MQALLYGNEILNKKMKCAKPLPHWWQPKTWIVYCEALEIHLMNALPISPLVSANHDKGGEHNHTFTNGKIQLDKVEEHVLAASNKKRFINTIFASGSSRIAPSMSFAVSCTWRITTSCMCSHQSNCNLTAAVACTKKGTEFVKSMSKYWKVDQIVEWVTC